MSMYIIYICVCVGGGGGSCSMFRLHCDDLDTVKLREGGGWKVSGGIKRPSVERE